MNTPAQVPRNYVLVLRTGSRVQNGLETRDPGRVYYVAQLQMDTVPGLDQVTIHELAAGADSSHLSCAADGDEDTRTLVYSATLPLRAGGVWNETFYQGFQEKALGAEVGRRDVWCL